MRDGLFQGFAQMVAACFLAIAAAALMFALPCRAYAAPDRPSPALHGAGLQAATTDDASDVDVYVYSENETVDQGTGVTWVYDLSRLMSDVSDEDDAQTSISPTAGTGSVSCRPVAGEDLCFSISAVRAGSVTLTCTVTWTESEDEWDETRQEYVARTIQRTESRSFNVNVVDVKNTSGTLSACVTGNLTSKLFTFKISGLPAGTDVTLAGDSNKKGGSWLRAVEQGKVTLYVYGIGTHAMRLSACGKTFSCKAVLRTLSLKKTAEVKNTESLVTYPGRKSVVQVKVTGVKNPKVKWSSTNKSIAKVSKKGVVRAKGMGRCYLKAKYGGATVKVLVEVTSQEAYQAVQNGFADMRTKLTYSQATRMSRENRDCSSFVSRCYWDDSLGRHIFMIGGIGAASWAYNAAGQAQWLEGQGKRVAWKACSVKKLRPGDTVYFETDYAGKDASQWRYIDHAGMYVGNGLILNTGGYGGKGTIGFRRYWAQDSSVKFIGRPCP